VFLLHAFFQVFLLIFRFACNYSSSLAKGCDSGPPFSM
jgi:hypothetical protein